MNAFLMTVLRVWGQYLSAPYRGTALGGSVALVTVGHGASTGGHCAPRLKENRFAGISAFLPSMVKAEVFSQSGRHDHSPSAPASAPAAVAAADRPETRCNLHEKRCHDSVAPASLRSLCLQLGNAPSASRASCRCSGMLMRNAHTHHSRRTSTLSAPVPRLPQFAASLAVSARNPLRWHN